MLLLILILFILIHIIYKFNFKHRSIKKNISKIKYDCRDRKLFLIFASINTSITIFLCIISTTHILNEISDEAATFIILGGYIFFPFVSLLLWLYVLRSTFYLKRLKVYGYQVPCNKKDFYSSINQLPRINTTIINSSGRNRESFMLSVFSLCIFLGVVLNIVVFYFQHELMGDLAYFGAYGSVPLLIFWFILSGMYWNQSYTQKYSDDVEADITRKQRKQIEDGIIEILILLFFTIIWIVVLDNGADMIYKSRVAAGYYG